MNKIFKYLFFLLPIFANAQLDTYNIRYADCEENSYQEQWGINLSIPNIGNYSKSKKNLQSTYFSNHSKESFFIESLLNYNTLGKIKTHQKIDASIFSSEEKAFFKLWLSYYTKNIDDYKKYLSDFKSKYKDNLSLIKLELRKELVENSKIISRNEKKFSDITVKIDSLLLTDMSSEDRLYFSLLKIDFTVFDNDLKKNNEKEIEQFKGIWNLSKNQMNYKSVKRIVNDCKSNCDEIKNWVNEKHNQTLTSAEKVYFLLDSQTKEELKISTAILEDKITEIVSNETDKMQKDHIIDLVSSYNIEDNPDLKYYFEVEKISFSEDFKKKYILKCTKETCFEKLKNLSAYFTDTLIGKSVNIKDYNDYNKYSLQEIQQGYLAFLNLNYRNKKKILYYENDLATYVDSKPLEFNSKISENIKYLTNNPLYFNDLDFISNGSFKEIKTYSDLKKLNAEMDKLTLRYPGSIGIKHRQILFKSYFNNLVNKDELQNFYLDYFKNVVDFFALNQEKKFSRYADRFFKPYVSQENRWDVFSVLYKKLSNETKVKVSNYLFLKINENPNSKNLQDISESLLKETL